MRDPERINKICSELADIWNKVPDWRLMQLIINFVSYKRSDCFYMEDEKLIKELKEYINKFNN